MDGKEYLQLNINKAKTYNKLLEDGYANSISFNSNFIEAHKIFSLERKHLFTGYYDINNISPDGTRLLCLSVDEDATPGKDIANINIIDLNNDSIQPIFKTHAWNWQQGSRLRWINDDEIMFNDFINGEYCTTIYDLKGKCVLRRLNSAFYDVSLSKGFALSLNFERLDSLRPGYGYNNKKIIDEALIPNDDGIFVINLSDNTKTKLIDFKDILGYAPLDNRKHYLNHISINKSGTRFMFFHLWTRDYLDMWNMNVFVSNLNGELKCIENNEIVSHYTWLNDDELLLTVVNNNDKCYVKYNLITGEKLVLANDMLVNDGHPTLINSKGDFISDTYPLANCIQTLFISNIKLKRFDWLIKAFSDPRLFIDKRCDMHPKFDSKTQSINIDSTYSNGVRKIIYIKLKDIL